MSATGGRARAAMIRMELARAVNAACVILDRLREGGAIPPHPDGVVVIQRATFDLLYRELDAACKSFALDGQQTGQFLRPNELVMVRLQGEDGQWFGRFVEYRPAGSLVKVWRDAATAWSTETFRAVTVRAATNREIDWYVHQGARVV